MTLVLLDTNAYLRLAKRVKPLLGVPFGQKSYVLTILKDVEDEVQRSGRLRSTYPWVNDPALVQERLAKRINLSAAEKAQLDITVSIFLGHVQGNIDRFLVNGRDPPSPVDCRVLGFTQIRSPAIVVTDDLGMHALAADFGIEIWHGYELLSKLRTAKKVSNDLIREIYAALETNRDMTRTWAEAKHTTFRKVFGSGKVEK